MRVYSDGSPAVNVKVYANLFPMVAKIQEEFKCSEAVAQKALDIAYESAVEQFWAEIQETASAILDDVNGCVSGIRSEGRSGGWLVIEGLMPVEEWGSRQTKKWLRFEKAVTDEIADRIRWDNIRGAIAANGWVEPKRSFEDVMEHLRHAIQPDDANLHGLLDELESVR